ncbi:MAG: carboxylesterase/lipase family protein [Burkholderiaceae bacterium]
MRRDRAVAWAALALWSALAPTTASAATSDEAAPTISTPAGTIEGVRIDDIAVFRGLPYAAAPVGDLRWRAPRSEPSWTGVRKADRFGSACPQKAGLSLEGGGDPGPLNEDCLFLNVWTPRAATDARLPVMVWFHGGALIFGAGSLPLYDGSALARRGVVVVTVNYRLGPLGYFVHPALEKADPGGAANFGLLDQIAALRWVKSRIAAFGGDPDHVTIFGQSAGAQSVLALMASPPAQGLFQRAIAQSPYGIPSHTRAQARAVGIKLADAVGLRGADATVAQLRAVPAERLADLQGAGLSLAPSLIVGDAAMPRTILSAFQEKRQAAVPLIVGSNSDETSVAVSFGIKPAVLVQKMGAAKILVGPLYPNVGDDAELGRQVVRDVVFSAFARRVAVLQAQRAPTWRYYFDQSPAQARGRQPGVAHGGEVPAVFGTGDTCDCLAFAMNDVDRAASRAIAERWVAFAKNGRPDLPSAPWPSDTLWKPVALEFADTPIVRRGFMAHRLNVFIGALKLVGPARSAD